MVTIKRIQFKEHDPKREIERIKNQKIIDEVNALIYGKKSFNLFHFIKICWHRITSKDTI